MTHNAFRRREFLESCIVRGLLVGATALSQARLLAAWDEAQAKAKNPTPTEDLGPFYKKGAPNKAQLRIPRESGLPLRISGKILDTRGEPVHGARVELWHADPRGFYDLRGFRYRAKLDLGSATDYQVETVMPGHYPDRPAQHVHYLIHAPGHKPLVTQLYFATDPFFEGDLEKNHAKLGLVSHRECIRPVTLLEEATSPRSAVSFDLVLEKA